MQSYSGNYGSRQGRIHSGNGRINIDKTLCPLCGFDSLRKSAVCAIKMNEEYEIRPICAEEWLPDRCLSIKMPLEINNLIPQHGCPNLLFGKTKIRDRVEFEDFYHKVLNRFSCCGFIAWKGDRVIGYTNFFPHEIARTMKFYGWGEMENEGSGTLIHHCISMIQNDNYRCKGIGTSLVRHSLDWAKIHQWKRYEVHRVLPDIHKGIVDEQKSTLPFWKKLGFSIVREEEADLETKKYYGVDKRYSLALDF